MTEPSVIISQRRFLRFGLRTFLLFVTLVACAAGWIGVQVKRCHEEQQAIARLTASAAGGHLQILYGSRFRDVESGVTGEPGFPDALFHGGPAWLTRLLSVDIFRAAVNFRSSPPGNTFSYDRDDSGRLVIHSQFKNGLTDADMHWVNGLRYLRFLSLEANGITDEGLKQLDNLPYIETLWLSNTPITDEGLSALSNFPRLCNLGLRSTSVTDAAIGDLAKCKSLRKLNLQMTNVTEAGANSLRKLLPNCDIEL